MEKKIDLEKHIQWASDGGYGHIPKEDLVQINEDMKAMLEMIKKSINYGEVSREISLNSSYIKTNLERYDFIIKMKSKYVFKSEEITKKEKKDIDLKDVLRFKPNKKDELI